MRHIVGWVLVAAAGLGCAHDVAQDRATGPDGKHSGARPIVVEDGEGQTRGIVTYPGGDRVDWKQIELPEGKRGSLDLQLTWQAPRPGLQVAFDVFDQWYRPVGGTRAVARKHARMRTATIPDARGSYFVRVYAPKRGDAGAYKLVARFEEEPPPPPPVDPRVYPDPPRLPSVPPPEAECLVFDVGNPACRAECDPAAPPRWPGCAARDKAEADKVAREQAESERLEREAKAPKPVEAQIISYAITSGGVLVTLAIGTTSAPALDKTWRGAVLRASTGSALIGGSLVIVRVGKTQTIAKSTLTTDQLSANPQVRLSPP